MTMFKRIAAGVVAVATMVSISASTYAEAWQINYIKGAPSSVSTQFVKKEFIGLLPTTNVYVSCKVTTGSVELSTTGFNPNPNSTIFYPSLTKYETLREPDYAGCSVTLRANDNRVVADGTITV